MWQGKLKALTFSFDDGVWQDERLIDILNKYGLKGTFNLNSSIFGLPNQSTVGDRIIRKDVIKPSRVKDIYRGHEIASHSLAHPHLFDLDEDTLVFQVEEDRRILERLVGYDVCGFVYPYGDFDDRIVSIIKNNTPIKYARTAESTYSFEPQENLIKFNPTIHFLDWDKLYEIAEQFINLKPTKPQIFYVWGHAYELDWSDGNWKKFEEFCKYISGKEDVYYGTNKNVLLFEE